MNRNVIICRSILENPAITQRELAQALDVSLGTANNLVKECISEHLIALGGAYEPFSYTHLDVYKRQVQPFPLYHQKQIASFV